MTIMQRYKTSKQLFMIDCEFVWWGSRSNFKVYVVEVAPHLWMRPRTFEHICSGMDWDVYLEFCDWWQCVSERKWSLLHIHCFCLSWSCFWISLCLWCDWLTAWFSDGFLCWWTDCFIEYSFRLKNGPRCRYNNYHTFYTLMSLNSLFMVVVPRRTPAGHFTWLRHSTMIFLVSIEK